MQFGIVTHATKFHSERIKHYLLHATTLLGAASLYQHSNISNINANVSGTRCCLSVQEQHWAWQHEAMEAVLAYMRLSTNGDFIQLVPTALHNPGK